MMQIEHLALDAADWKIGVVVDRQIAKIGAGAFSKAWKRGGGQAVLLSCHYDVLDWNYTVAVNAKK